MTKTKNPVRFSESNTGNAPIIIKINFSDTFFSSKKKGRENNEKYATVIKGVKLIAWNSRTGMYKIKCTIEAIQNKK